MAVSIQARLYSTSGMWNMGDPPTVFSSTGSELVPPPLAYQYPLPTSGLDTPSNIIPGFHHLPVGIPESESSSQAKPLPSLIKNRGNSISSKSAKVKRSLSTPNVRGQATADAAAIALSAEKRRNKLGYHRTSVACGEQAFYRNDAFAMPLVSIMAN